MSAPTAVRAWPRELGGVAAALLMTTIVVAHLVSSERRVLLFSDGDSVLTGLVIRSLAIGQPQDWAMSSVLFLPELAMFGGLSLLGLGLTATLTLNAFVSYLALYGALRLVAGARSHARLPVAGALLAFGAFCALSLLEASPDRNALQLASLLGTTTYYSATVVAVVITIGLARRMLDDGQRRLRSRAVLIGAVAAASVLSNPLFLAWAVVPVGGLLGATALARRSQRGAAWPAAIALVVGSGLGLLGRIPLAPFIANTGVGYIDPGGGVESIGYYGRLLSERAQSVEGAIALTLSICVWVVAVALSVLALRRRADAVAFVAASAWVTPVLVVIGAIALGTHAARYLEPTAFAPVLALAVLPQLFRVRDTPALPVIGDAPTAVGAAGDSSPQPVGAPRVPRGNAPRRVAVLAGAVAAVILATLATTGVPRLIEGATRSDPDVDCVTDWVAASGRTGAGQFWTVRTPKAHLDDPRGLVQVDDHLNGYAWLVNRDDYEAEAVSFLVIDDQSLPFVLPDDLSMQDASITTCGRYTIADFDPFAIRIGPLRS